MSLSRKKIEIENRPNNNNNNNNNNNFDSSMVWASPQTITKNLPNHARDSKYEIIIITCFFFFSPSPPLAPASAGVIPASALSWWLETSLASKNFLTTSGGGSMRSMPITRFITWELKRKKMKCPIFFF